MSLSLTDIIGWITNDGSAAMSVHVAINHRHENQQNEH